MISPPLRTLAVLSTCILAPLSLHAQLQWDPGLTPGSPSGGYGTWDSTTANWSNGTTNTTWNGGTAVFGGSGNSTVQVSGAIPITGLTEGTGAYSNTVISGGELTTSGSTAIDFIANSSANNTGAEFEIASNISGSGSLVLSNNSGQTTREIILRGANTYTGDTTVNGGIILYIDSNANLGAANSAVNIAPSASNSAATLQIRQATTLNRPVNLSGGVELSISQTTYSSTLAGVISGDGALRLNAYVNGTLRIAAANTYTGSTYLWSVAGGSVVLDADNAFPDTPIRIYGTVVNLNGHSDVLGALTAELTQAATIDFAAGASSLTFADSSAATWTGSSTLNLTNFVTGTDLLRFGTDANGLTSSQLAMIKFDGATAAQIDSLGFVTPATSAVPEPASAAALLGLVVLAGTALRRCPRA